MIDLPTLVAECAPQIHPLTMISILATESSIRPLAIGVVGGSLKRQPKTLDEAVAVAEDLERAGRNFSVGIAQVNRYNLAPYGLTYRMAFDPCTNLRVASQVLEACYKRAAREVDGKYEVVHAALSCFYSGNFKRGFIADDRSGKSYVDRVLAASYTVPELKPIDRGENQVQSPATPRSQLPPLPTPIGSSAPNSPARASVIESARQSEDTGAGDVFKSAIGDAFTKPRQ